MKTIIVREINNPTDSNNYQAYVVSDRPFYGVGVTQSEALWDLIRNAPEEVGIQVFQPLNKSNRAVVDLAKNYDFCNNGEQYAE